MPADLTAADWQVAIPSSGRAGTLATKTLPLLLNRNVPADRVSVFVAAREVEDYSPTCTEAGVWLRVGAAGMGGNRNAIARHYPPGTPVVQIDDDLSDLRERLNTTTTEPVADVAALFTGAFLLAEQSGANLWGIYPVLNPMFMKPRARTDLTYIVGCLWGARQYGLPHQLVHLDDKEDFERTLRYYLHDGQLLRLEWVAPKTRYYTEPGGMQQDRTADRVTASAQQIHAWWPDLCAVRTSKAGRAELRLRDRR
jgi:hypothetical protein